MGSGGAGTSLRAARGAVPMPGALSIDRRPSLWRQAREDGIGAPMGIPSVVVAEDLLRKNQHPCSEASRGFEAGNHYV